MKKELAIKECENEIKDFEERGASAKGYLDFYKNEWQKIGSDYTEEQVVAIYEADKVGTESAKKRYLELTGKEYGQIETLEKRQQQQLNRERNKRAKIIKKIQQEFRVASEELESIERLNASDCSTNFNGRELDRFEELGFLNNILRLKGSERDFSPLLAVTLTNRWNVLTNAIKEVTQKL